EFLSMSNSAHVSINGDKEEFALRGSRSALTKLRKTCFSGKIPKKADFKWDFTKSEYGEPNWITYAIPNSDSYIFGAFCEPKGNKVTIELFGAESEKSEGIVAIAKYASSSLRGNLKGRINEFGWPQTSISKNSEFWKALAGSRRTEFTYDRKVAGRVRVKRVEPALRKFYKACSIVVEDSPKTKKPIQFSPAFTASGSTLVLSDIWRLSALPDRISYELQGAVKTLSLDGDEVECRGLELGSAFKNLSGLKIPPYKCEVGDKTLTIKAKTQFSDEKSVLKKNANAFEKAMAARFYGFSWSIK
ncbi:MAG: hypothetical protein ACPGVN_03275, partial [Alphaproteobacteria bacterium]